MSKFFYNSLYPDYKSPKKTLEKQNFMGLFLVFDGSRFTQGDRCNYLKQLLYHEKVES